MTSRSARAMLSKIPATHGALEQRRENLSAPMPAVTARAIPAITFVCLLTVSAIASANLTAPTPLVGWEEEKYTSVPATRTVDWFLSSLPTLSALDAYDHLSGKTSYYKQLLGNNEVRWRERVEQSRVAYDSDAQEGFLRVGGTFYEAVDRWSTSPSVKDYTMEDLYYTLTVTGLQLPDSVPLTIHPNPIRQAVEAWDAASTATPGFYVAMSQACMQHGASLGTMSCPDFVDGFQDYLAGVSAPTWIDVASQTYQSTGALCSMPSGTPPSKVTVAISSAVCVVDTDRDGWADTVEVAWGSDPAAADSIPGNAVDSDEDGWNNSDDNCPSAQNFEQRDQDGDHLGDACDSDRDGDGYSNSADLFPDDGSEWADNDHDGVGDNGDNCPGLTNQQQQDNDGDGAGDACDSDDDNDGVADTSDNCPMHANANQANYDGDSQGDVCDSDDDNDGRADRSDAFPFNSAEWADSDGDGIGNNADNCPYAGNSNQANTFGDSRGDACEDRRNDPNWDSDNDGINNGLDNCPAVANGSQTDSDGDGIGNACDGDLDGDGVANASDNCPSVSNANQADMDGDGVGDVCDSDMDGDGALNEADSHPSNAAQQRDSDGDGLQDANDNCPNRSNANQADLDEDGIGDACDADEDGDGVANGQDSHPRNRQRSGVDTDRDGWDNAVDLCPQHYSRGNYDFDRDGAGDICDIEQASITMFAASSFRSWLSSEHGSTHVTTNIHEYQNQLSTYFMNELNVNLVWQQPSTGSPNHYVEANDSGFCGSSFDDYWDDAELAVGTTPGLRYWQAGFGVENCWTQTPDVLGQYWEGRRMALGALWSGDAPYRSGDVWGTKDVAIAIHELGHAWLMDDHMNRASYDISDIGAQYVEGASQNPQYTVRQDPSTGTGPPRIVTTPAATQNLCQTANGVPERWGDSTCIYTGDGYPDFPYGGVRRVGIAPDGCPQVLPVHDYVGINAEDRDWETMSYGIIGFGRLQYGGVLWNNGGVNIYERW